MFLKAEAVLVHSALSLDHEPPAPLRLPLPQSPSMGEHLVFLLQVAHSAQALAIVLGCGRGQLLLNPGHFLISIPEEL